MKKTILIMLSLALLPLNLLALNIDEQLNKLDKEIRKQVMSHAEEIDEQYHNFASNETAQAPAEEQPMTRGEYIDATYHNADAQTEIPAYQAPAQDPNFVDPYHEFLRPAEEEQTSEKTQKQPKKQKSTRHMTHGEYIDATYHNADAQTESPAYQAPAQDPNFVDPYHEFLRPAEEEQTPSTSPSSTAQNTTENATMTAEEDTEQTEN